MYKIWNIGYIDKVHDCMMFKLTGMSDCVLALGFEKMQRGSLGGKVGVLHAYTDYL